MLLAAERPEAASRSAPEPPMTSTDVISTYQMVEVSGIGFGPYPEGDRWRLVS
jgi:hypothetical protein